MSNELQSSFKETKGQWVQTVTIVKRSILTNKNSCLLFSHQAAEEGVNNCVAVPGDLVHFQL